MPTLKHRLVAKRLTGKFRFARGNNDHIIFTLHHNGKYVLETKLSHESGNTDLGKNLVGAIAREMRLSGKQFRDAIQCQLSREDYLNVLAEKGLL